ncbi:MAG: hypothetical protein PHD48_10180 [Alphaproteobacteria bacterium]|nr:hypothetical protein [Alphaproteobacteria bacterium]
MSNKIPTPSQIRAALGALKWEYKDLSAASGVSVDALSLICLEKHEAQEKTRSKVRQAIESAGIEFLDNDGIRRVSKEVEIYVGKERFHEFTEFIYRRLLERGGTFASAQ